MRGYVWIKVSMLSKLKCQLLVNFEFNFDQVKNIVTATKVGFDHLSLDYTFQVQHIYFFNHNNLTHNLRRIIFKAW